MTQAIKCQDLCFSYDQTSVLKNVNVEIPAGDFVCVTGPNGGGKTTMLKLILGLLSPDGGSVCVLGETPNKARRKVGYVPQHPHLDPLFPASVLDVVLMGRLGHAPTVGSWRKQDTEAALQSLSEVDLVDRANAHFASLSTGQKQRVLIARALACMPELLLLDEPTAGLDVATEEGFYRLLQNLNERLTVILVSHDLGFVSQFVRSVVCVGHNVVIHPTSEITGEVIAELYGTDMRLVRHDHRCSEGGHKCI